MRGLLLPVLALLPPGAASAGVLCWAGAKANEAAADVDLTPPPGLGDLVEVDANGQRGCGLDAAGLVKCWGSGRQWSLPVPARLWHVGTQLLCIAPRAGGVECLDNKGKGMKHRKTLARGEHVKGVASYFQIVCYLDATGSPVCSGADIMPDGSEWGVAMHSVGATKIVLGMWACMLGGSPGRLMCWRYRLTMPPLPLDLPDVVHDMDMFSGFLCVVTLQREVKCWGQFTFNTSGALPVDNTWAPFSTVAVGSSVACGQSLAGPLVCWGDATSVAAVPRGLVNTSSVGAGGRNVCALFCEPTTSTSTSTTLGPSSARSPSGLFPAAQSAFSGAGSAVSGGLPGSFVGISTTAAALLPPVTAAAALLATERDRSSPLLGQLFHRSAPGGCGCNSTSAPLPNGGTISAHILRGDVGGKFQELVVPPNLGVYVPLSVHKHVNWQDGFAVVVSAFDPEENPNVLGLSGQVAPIVLGAAVLSLRRLSDYKEVHVSGLQHAIRFSLPVNYTAGLWCAYWDESLLAWSFEGVSTDPNNVEGELIWCSTTHLSLFGAIMRGAVEALVCTNFVALFTWQALFQLFVGKWYLAPGSLLFFGLILFLLGAAGAAWLLDVHRARDFLWGASNDFFILPNEEVSDRMSEKSSLRRRGSEVSSVTSSMALTPGGSKLAEKQDESAFHAAIPLMACSTLCCGCSCCAMAHDNSRSVMLDAIWDICASWFQGLGEVCAVLSAFFGSLSPDSGALGTGLMLGRLASGALHLSARRGASAHLGLSGSTVRHADGSRELSRFYQEEQRRDSRSTPDSEVTPAYSSEGRGDGPVMAPALSMDSAKGLASMSTTISWRTIPSQRQSWKMIKKEVSEQLLEQTRMQAERPQFVKTICETFAHYNPVAALFAVDIFRSCKQRCLLLAAETLGALAFCCLFFNAAGLTGGSRGDGCGVRRDRPLGESIGRFFIVAVASLLTAGLPIALLRCLQTKFFHRMSCGTDGEPYRRRLRVWQVQERLFWVLGLVYCGLCVVYILVFLANIGDGDHQALSLSAALALLQDLLLLPLLTAVLAPLGARLLLCLYLAMSGLGREEFLKTACQRFRDRKAVSPAEITTPEEEA